jgi:regulator of sirC expression with transglutaminase-like and TPR domain
LNKLSNEREIKALLQLLDDPDEAIYSVVSSKINELGPRVIPRLEEYWLDAENELIQGRIESLIQKVSLRDIREKLNAWEENPTASLFEAMVQISRYSQPNLDADKLKNTLKSIHRSCWLELNNYLTPLEEVHIVNSILYSMYSLSADRNSLKDSNSYFLSNVLTHRKGNQFSLALIYLLITKMLDIPVFALKISNFVILGYVNTLYDFDKGLESPILSTQFFIEPTEGTILSKQDVDSFIKKYDVTLTENSFEPLKNIEFVQHYTNALAKSYEEAGETEKAEDIRSLISQPPSSLGES